MARAVKKSAVTAAPAPESGRAHRHYVPACAPYEAPSDAYTLDHMFHGTVAQLTGGLSPTSLGLAAFDWWSHLFFSPSKRQMLRRSWGEKALQFAEYAMKTALSEDPPPVIAPAPGDSRFKDESWQRWPFNLYHQGFLLWDAWWQEATHGVRGVSKHHQDVVSFIARQWLDMWSPSNFPPTNPEILRTAFEQGGQNFLRGALNLAEDALYTLSDMPPPEADSFVPGETVAVTEGKVIFRNHLMELIQYAPATEEVFAEPLLIVPAWIMKYYILDLSPHNSLVRYLVEKGHTVFMISWKNPDACDRGLGMEDYLEHGLGEALKAVKAVTGRNAHGVGYCLGGTLLSIMAAKLARDGHDGLETVTLFAAQTDFEEAGEITLFVDESQTAYLEDVMWNQGYLDKHQMAGAFQMLRSNDLIWSRLIGSYLQGKRRSLNDLMAWNADATRLPYRMHSEYLRRLFLQNDLAEGRYDVGGAPVALKDVHLPIFAVGTVRDHVAPWKSVYKIHLLTDSDVTFVLTSGGHNAGIVSEPGHKGRSYQISTMERTDVYLPPDSWQNVTPRVEGSWWIAWAEWLAAHSGAKRTPPPMGNAAEGYAPLEDAPGTYVFLR